MLFHRKILFLISTVAVVITLLLFIGCNKNPETTTDIETTQVTVTTTPSTTEFEWPLDIPYPIHSEERISQILSTEFNEFEEDTESFIYINYLDDEKTEYQLYYAYVRQVVVLESAYSIYVKDGVIRQIKPTPFPEEAYNDSEWYFQEYHLKSDDEVLSNVKLSDKKEYIRDFQTDAFERMVLFCEEMRTNPHGYDPLNPLGMLLFYYIYPDVIFLSQNYKDVFVYGEDLSHMICCRYTIYCPSYNTVDTTTNTPSTEQTPQ